MKQITNPAVLSSKFAFFTTTESEAISSLSEAYKKIYEDSPVVTGFVDEDSEFAGQAPGGAEIYTIRTKVEDNENKGGGIWGRTASQKPKLSNYEEETDFDGTIRIDYYMDECLLSIQIFDEEDGLPLNDNIMLVKCLSEMSLNQ